MTIQQETTLIEYDALPIGGQWRTPATSAVIEVASASTGERIGRVPDSADADVDAAVDAARRAFDDPSGWSTWEPARRAEVLRRFADEIEGRATELATRVSSQNGMPIALSTFIEAGGPVGILRQYAALAETELGEREQLDFAGRTTIVRREAYGVVAAIAPWNFPQALASFKYAPALAAGNTVVVKPSPETVLDTFLVSEAATAAGIPPGVFNVVTGGREAGSHLVAHPGVDRVAFTGSTAAGRQIGETCGRLVRPVTLELGGKSAAIVLDDADLDLATIGQSLYGATLLNGGQTCYLSTRILAPRSRYDEVVDTIATFASSLSVGDALDPSTLIGPMVSEAHRERVERYIASGKESSRLVVGGGRPTGLDSGWFVEPTVFADVDPRSVIAQEEIFGPVLAVIPYDTVDDAVRIANDSEYGLAGSVWTVDAARGVDIARRIRTGSVGINRYEPDLSAPFGGVKSSGIGRELGLDGLLSYTQTKSIYT